MKENEIGKPIVDAALQIHREVGPGLLESVSEQALEYELRVREISVQRQAPISIRYKEIEIEAGFRADMIVNSSVLVELKSVEEIMPVHKKQTLTYLKLSGLRLGFLINFGAALIKDGIVRFANGLPDL